MGRFVVRVASGWAFVCATSCSSPPPPPSEVSQDTNVSAECANVCWHEEACGTMPDEVQCASNCGEGLILPQWRSDFTAALTRCYSGSSCASSTAFSDCNAQALTDITPTSKDRVFCDALSAAAQRCNATFSTTACVDETEQFSDMTLSGAVGCANQSCDLVGTCVAASLPGYTP